VKPRAREAQRMMGQVAMRNGVMLVRGRVRRAWESGRGRRRKRW